MGGLYFPCVPRIHLLTVGEAFQDLVFAGLPRLPRDGEELRTMAFASTIGGGAVITAVAASRLGLRGAIVSALSQDAAGALRREKVRIVNVKRPHEAPAVSVSLSTKRDRSFVTFNGVNDQLEARLPRAIAGLRARHVHFAFAPRDCARWTRIAAAMRADEVTTSWDFGWNPPLRRAAGFRALLRSADFIFVNEAEASLYALSRSNTIVKLGSKGSRWIGGARRLQPSDQLSDLFAPAPRARVVDTTGAGDAFNAGFLVAFLTGRKPIDCLRAGNLAGAHSTEALGGLAGLPSRSAALQGCPPAVGKPEGLRDAKAGHR